MPRTIVDLPSAQIRDLDARCRALGISRAEAVRRAVHAFLNVRSPLDEEGFGLWARSASDASGRVRAARGDEAG
jgi:Ribbon-helix-helix protein, copG family